MATIKQLRQRSNFSTLRTPDDLVNRNFDQIAIALRALEASMDQAADALADDIPSIDPPGASTGGGCVPNRIAWWLDASTLTCDDDLRFVPGIGIDARDPTHRFGAGALQTSGTEQVVVGQTSAVSGVPDGNALTVAITYGSAIAGVNIVALNAQVRNNANSGGLSAGAIFWQKRTFSDKADLVIRPTVVGTVAAPMYVTNESRVGIGHIVAAQMPVGTPSAGSFILARLHLFEVDTAQTTVTDVEIIEHTVAPLVATLAGFGSAILWKGLNARDIEIGGPEVQIMGRLAVLWQETPTTSSAKASMRTYLQSANTVAWDTYVGGAIAPDGAGVLGPGTPLVGEGGIRYVSGSTKRWQVYDETENAWSNIVSELSHLDLLQLIHFIDEGPALGFTTGATKLVTGGTFPSAVLWSRSDATKLVEKLITRDSGQKPTTIQWKMYAANGTTVLETVTDTITYSGPFEVSRARAIA